MVAVSMWIKNKLKGFKGCRQCFILYMITILSKK